MAKYPYTVKYNGKYYMAGEDVPEKEAAKQAAPSDEGKKKPSRTLPREKGE